MAALLEPSVVFASFASPDGTPPGHEMQWPGTELQRSEWFSEVQQFVIERCLTMSAGDYVGHLSTISGLSRIASLGARAGI